MATHSISVVDEVCWNTQGLVPAIAQEASTGGVLMMAWMNRQSLRMTIDSGRAVYWSRSRQAIWVKGETSGCAQSVHDILLDCDADAILLKVTQHGGAACHTGRKSCFYRQLDKDQWLTIMQPVVNVSRATP